MTLDDLRSDIAVDVETSALTLDNLDELAARVAERGPDMREMAAMALYVRDVYHGVEDVLVRLLKYPGQGRPRGADWHLTLAAMFTSATVPGLPDLITPDLREPLAALRGFRHVAQNRYAAHLAWGKLRPLVEQVGNTSRRFHENVAAHLQAIDASNQN